MIIHSSPSYNGYVLMPDYEHKSTLILFPFRKDIWNNVEQAQKIHIEFIKKISQYERVYVGVRKNEMDMLDAIQNENIVVFELAQDDAWIRDSGPLFVKKGDEIKMVKNGFNAWAGLYDNWDNDLKITETLSKLFQCDYYENDFILEGGNITTDGKGTAILVEECIVNPNRNPQSKEEIEALLKKGLGLKQIIWLKHGFVNDETGGHIDNVCRFLPDDSVVISWTDDKEHPMYQRCREIEKQLIDQASYLTIHKLILPAAQYRQNEETVVYKGTKNRLSKELLTASYINYYETNKAVFIPQFGVSEDKEAEQQFKQLFKGREIIPIYIREYILAGGGLHCLTLGVNFKEETL